MSVVDVMAFQIKKVITGGQERGRLILMRTLISRLYQQRGDVWEGLLIRIVEDLTRGMPE